VNAVSRPVPGDDTQVSYKCENDLVMEGPPTSTCDQGTGQWTELPRCIRPGLSGSVSMDPRDLVPRDIIPVNAEAINRSSFSVISIIAIHFCVFSYFS
jgi:hypothetical protein